MSLSSINQRPKVDACPNSQRTRHDQLFVMVPFVISTYKGGSIWVLIILKDLQFCMILSNIYTHRKSFTSRREYLSSKLEEKKILNLSLMSYLLLLKKVASHSLSSYLETEFFSRTKPGQLRNHIVAIKSGKMRRDPDSETQVLSFSY